MTGCDMGFDARAKAYFETLPAVLQAQIVQSGVKLKTREDLEKYCKNALEQNNAAQ